MRMKTLTLIVSGNGPIRLDDVSRTKFGCAGSISLSKSPHAARSPLVTSTMNMVKEGGWLVSSYR